MGLTGRKLGDFVVESSGIIDIDGTALRDGALLLMNEGEYEG